MTATAVTREKEGDGRNARLKGLLPQSLSTARVLVVGAGSVGSLMAEALCRAGVGCLDVIDPDTVEAANLTRTVYTAADIGKPKAMCLARRLEAIDPACTVTATAKRLQEMDKAKLKSLVAATDLIIGAADDPVCQVLLNRISQYYKKPALFIGLYKRGHGGEVVLSVPGLSACLECYAGKVRFTARNRVEREVNYGTGRLDGEIALGSDIQHVTSAATKIALSLLALLSGDSTVSAGQFVMPLLASKRTVALFGMEPNFYVFPEALADAVAQYAFQSVWLTVHRKDACPCCGSAVPGENPIDVMSGIIGTDSRNKLRAAAATTNGTAPAVAKNAGESKNAKP